MAYSIMCKKLFVRIFAFILVMLERILGTFFFGPPYMMPKCMSCHKAIVVITERAHCFYDDTYDARLVSVRFKQSLCRGSLMTTSSWLPMSFSVKAKNLL